MNDKETIADIFTKAGISYSTRNGNLIETDSGVTLTFSASDQLSDISGYDYGDDE